MLALFDLLFDLLEGNHGLQKRSCLGWEKLTLTPSSGIPKMRTWGQKLSPGLLVTFMTTHLFQFRFADTEQYWLITKMFFRTWDQKWSSGLMLVTFTCLALDETAR